jgi:hypothetical protein
MTFKEEKSMKKITSIVIASVMMFTGANLMADSGSHFINPSEVTNTTKDNENSNSIPESKVVNPKPAVTNTHSTTTTTTTNYGR